jgi:hypothetical protein
LQRKVRGPRRIHRAPAAPAFSGGLLSRACQPVWLGLPSCLQAGRRLIRVGKLASPR